MPKFLSGRQKDLKLGVRNYTENKISLDVIGKVGIGSTFPSGLLDVGGDANIRGILGVSTLSPKNISFGVGSSITIAGSAGTDGQYLRSTGIGVTWASFPTLRTGFSTVGILSQTSISTIYNTDFVDVFINGVLLDSSEYQANNGIDIILDDPLTGGEIVNIFSYNTTSSYSGGGGGTVIINSGGSSLWSTGFVGIFTNSNVGIFTNNPTSPLTVNGNVNVSGILTSNTIHANNINSSQNVNVSGIITASQFIGDGSGLVNVIGTGSGVVILDSGVVVGTASTIDFGNKLSVSPISAGIVTITSDVDYQNNWDSTTIGINTISNVGIGTTTSSSKLTVNGTLRVSGISTFDGKVTFNGASDFNGGIIVNGVTTSTSFVGNGTRLTGIVTSLVAGSNIILSGSTGQITIDATGGGGISYWNKTTTGIHTLSNAGIGTTNPTSRLTVQGDGYFTGIVTATQFTTQTGGTPTIQSPNNLNLNANTVAISTNATVGNSLIVNQNLNVGGILTATSFVGNGSRLTGIITSIVAGSGIQVSGSTGVVTITASGGGTSSQWVTTTAGIHTLSNVGIGTTNPTSALTVKGNTSLETLNVSGVSTLSGRLDVSETVYLGTVGGNAEFRISRFGGKNTFDSISGPFEFTGNGGQVNFVNQNLNISGLTTTTNLNVSGISTTTRLNVGTGGTIITTSSSGFVGIGTTNPQGTLQVGAAVTIYGNSGIVSATTFYGNLVGSITDATNLTGGYANASSLNVSGISTISQGRIQADAGANLRFGNLPAGSGSGRNIAIGDQVLVSLSGGQGRNIGIGELSYYDTTTGQYNIGIGERAGQKVSTGSYNVILGAYDGNSGNLDIRTSSNNVVIADGQGNIRQYINSSGNVGIKTTVITEALTVAGIVSATSFYGTLNASQLTGSLPAIDGSALVGVVATGTGVEIRSNGTPVGTAGTINFGNNVNVTFASGIATVSGASSVSAATTAYALAGTPDLNVGIVTATSFKVGSSFLQQESLNLAGNIYSGNLVLSNRNLLFTGEWDGGSNYGDFVFQRRGTFGDLTQVARIYGSNGGADFNGTTKLAGISTFTSTGISIFTNLNSTGIITASSFSGSGASLTSLPAGQLTGNLPAIDGSALLNVNATGSGIVVLDDNANIGSARTVNFGTGLDVTYSTSGIATITASGGSLQSRTTVIGITTSIANNGIGNTNITGFKSYALMKVGLSTAGWLRLYTDSTSRSNDATRSQGVDPTPGSGVIAEVITTGISTTQIITPFVMGGNLDNPADTTIYAAITNLSGTTQAITATLTILQLEA